MSCIHGKFDTYSFKHKIKRLNQFSYDLWVYRFKGNYKWIKKTANVLTRQKKKYGNYNKVFIYFTLVKYMFNDVWPRIKCAMHWTRKESVWTERIECCVCVCFSNDRLGSLIESEILHPSESIGFYCVKPFYLQALFFFELFFLHSPLFFH